MLCCTVKTHQCCRDCSLVLRQEVSVWIIGSFLIKNAFVHARSKTGGVNLGLHRIGVKIWWQGYGGMGLKDLESTIKRLMKYEKAPKYVVLHIAGNDLEKTKLGFFRNEIKATLEKVQSYLPKSSIEDGVHLTDLGNDIFLNNLQGALEMFICSGTYTYPDTFGTSMCIS
ncbi:uncharacterized protein LOC134714365 [Mytilus trossulus]|uniref:uncharacterized protein LOC134714365 n=1 Tax=Mytilus trossulus TaxID=6551 RepID=UPI0030061B12